MFDHNPILQGARLNEISTTRRLAERAVPPLARSGPSRRVLINLAVVAVAGLALAGLIA
jgi:uncharacterized protein involved in exopolysaccharide biosynthesis